MGIWNENSIIIEFDGNLNPEGFIDWLVVVEEMFEFKEVPENKRVSLIATKLRGRASTWWKQLKLTRERVGQPRVTSEIKSHSGVMLGVEEESVPVYDTDIEYVIEEEEGFVGKRGFGGKEDNIEDVVVVANDLCSLMI
ncbi:hypothetical protein Tco_1383747 [Tanacetum coccineum]